MKGKSIVGENWEDVVIVSGTSGSGKDTLIRIALRALANIGLAVSATTRARKEGVEQEGVDYFFMSRAAFEEKAAAGGFIEWKNVHGNLYGTPAEQIKTMREAGRDLILLNIDPQGMLEVRKAHPGVTGVFILPPGAPELHRRLEERGRDEPEDVERRMREAKDQLEYADRYDYIILNEDKSRAAGDLIEILRAVRSGVTSDADPLRSIHHAALIRSVQNTFTEE